MEDKKTKWLTVNEVANQLRMATGTVYHLLRTGKLPGKKFGQQWRIPEEAVEMQSGDA